MRFDDGAADGQPHTSPVILGGEKCLEDLFRLLRGQSHTGIADRDQQLSISGFRLDSKLSSASRSPHCIDAVEHEVHGLEVLKQIKSDGKLRMIPVVVLTSSKEEKDMVASYKLGVNAYVVKPVDFHEFVNAIKELGVFWAIINEPPPRSVRK